MGLGDDKPEQQHYQVLEVAVDTATHFGISAVLLIEQ